MEAMGERGRSHGQGHGGLTRRLVDAARAIHYDGLPPDAVVVAKQCFLDWLGVTLAGSREPLAAILRDEVLAQGGRPQATLLGYAQRVSCQQAALVNGAASHALDYDDVHLMMSGHPSVPLVPAILALGEYRLVPGSAFLAAYVAGVEVECRIGASVMPGHYQAGWHATATLGTFGAAAGCAHLLGLDAEQWCHAIGIAGTQAAGLKSVFGTMCKPLHAGRAAANGVLAASLAARGFTSHPAVLETPQGFGTTLSTTFAPDRALEGLGERFAIEDVLFKYHAACFGTHATIEGILRLKERHGLTADQVEAIWLHVPPGHLSMCNIPEPTTGLEGKFSLRFTAALALVGDDTSELAFTDERVRDPTLAAVRDRVTVVPDPSLGGETEVVMKLTNRSTLRERVNMNQPLRDLERQWQRLNAKFRGLVSPILGPERTEQLMATVRHMEDLPSVTAITSQCVLPDVSEEPA